MLHRLVKGGKNSVQRKIAQKGELFLHKLPSFVLGGIKGLEPEAQLLVLIAGVTMNMLLALFIFIAISYGEVRISTTDPIYGNRVQNPSIVIVDSLKESPSIIRNI
jgi:membrane-associated protease RseP (regulator of RpoE activity)